MYSTAGKSILEPLCLFCFNCNDALISNLIDLGDSVEDKVNMFGKLKHSCQNSCLKKRNIFKNWNSPVSSSESSEQFSVLRQLCSWFPFLVNFFLTVEFPIILWIKSPKCLEDSPEKNHIKKDWLWQLFCYCGNSSSGWIFEIVEITRTLRSN